MASTNPPLELCHFGQPMRDKHFSFAPTYGPLNHGSFGTYPKSVRDRLRYCQDLAEARPDTFVRFQYPDMLDTNRKALADFLSLPVDEVVFVPNVTTAVNVVLRNLKFEEGDVIVLLSTVYGSVEKTVKHLEETTPVKTVNMTVQYPINDNSLVERFHDAIKGAKVEGKNVRLASFDTVSSLPGVMVPWERLVAICKAESVLSLVDGAHGVGCIDVPIAKIQPDFFTSNLHKWLYVPRGCAVFYVPKRNQHLIRTSLPTSHGYHPLPRDGEKEIFNPLMTAASRKSKFELLFEFVATIDVSNYLCIEEALRFRREACGGEEEILKYCMNLSNEAGKHAAVIFGTKVMENADATLMGCPMSNVGLPLKVGDGQGEIPEKDMYEAARWLTARMANEYDTYLPAFFHAGIFWTRLGGQIYLELEDFLVGVKAMKTLCERASKGEYLQASS